MKKKKRTNPYLVPSMSVLLAGMLVLSLIEPDRSFSDVENRSLARGADWSLNALQTGKTGEEMNTWFTDQIPGRNTFFHANYLIRKLSGQRELNSVFLGKGALLANPEEANEDLIRSSVDAINQFSSLQGIPCYVLTAPSAATIQPQKLPLDAQARNVNPSFDLIYSSLNGPAGVDVRSGLSDQKNEYIYYRTDHHWTSLGAAIASIQLLNSMGIAPNPEDFDRMPVSDTFEGTLASKTGSVGLEDRIEIAVSKNNPGYIVTWADGTQSSSIYNKDALKTKDQYQVFLGANQSRIRIDTDAQTDRTLLLFKDSYANSMIQYLLPYFSSITIIDPRYYYDDLDLVLGSDLYTDCAFVYSIDTFSTIPSLKDLLNSWNEKHVTPEA